MSRVAINPYELDVLSDQLAARRGGCVEGVVGLIVLAAAVAVAVAGAIAFVVVLLLLVVFVVVIVVVIRGPRICLGFSLTLPPGVPGVEGIKFMHAILIQM